MLIGGRQTARSPATEPFACARASCSRRSWTGLQGRARAKPIRGGNASCQVQPDTRTPKEPVSARSTTTKISGSRAVRSTRGGVRFSERRFGVQSVPINDRPARDTFSPPGSQPRGMARRGYPSTAAAGQDDLKPRPAVGPLADQAGGTGRRSPRTGSAAAHTLPWARP